MIFNNNKINPPERDFNKLKIIAIVIIITIIVLRLTWLEVGPKNIQSSEIFSSNIKSLYIDKSPNFLYKTPTLKNLRSTTIREIFSYSDFIGFFDNPTRTNKACLYTAITMLSLLFYHLSGTLWLSLALMLALMSRGVTIEAISLSSPHFFFCSLASISIYFCHYFLAKKTTPFLFISLLLLTFMTLLNIGFLPLVLWTVFSGIKKPYLWITTNIVSILLMIITTYVLTPDFHWLSTIQNAFSIPKRFIDLQFLVSLTLILIAFIDAVFRKDIVNRYLYSIPFILFFSVTYQHNILLTEYTDQQSQQLYPELLNMNQTYDLVCIAVGIFALHYLATNLIFRAQTVKEPS